MQSLKKVYMIGIGGIGMSALARYFREQNLEVCGSDKNLESETVKGLLKEGVTVFNQKEITDTELNTIFKKVDQIIYTVAIPDDNLELMLAREQNLKTATYAEILGQISVSKFTIAVAGTHGKTTTTAMTNEIAKNLNLNPTTIVGSFLFGENNKLTNFVPGGSNLFIVEACEYKRSFLNLSPDILIITNLEEDHLDYYKDLDDIKKAFFDLALRLPKNGKIICNATDPNLVEIIDAFKDKIVDYSNLIEKVPKLKTFGDHNKRNAAAATKAISSYLEIINSKIEEAKLFDAVKSFRGTWRRMEYKGQTKNGVLVYDDYGHHPTEILAALNSVRENFKHKKIAVFFGPHLHSRTKMFFDDFASALSMADKVFIYPIFRARAEEDFGVSAEILTTAISKFKPAEFVPDIKSVVDEIGNLDDKWVAILLGAGEVYQASQYMDFV